MVIFSILYYTHKKGPSLLGLWWYWNDPLAGGWREEATQDWPIGLNACTWRRALKSVACLLFLVGIKILVLPLLSWKMLLPGEDLWCFSWNQQNKRAHWIYCMIGFIYIHPKSADIKNELHKKIIFRDNNRPCGPTIILTHMFLTLLFSVAGLSGEPLCGLHTPGTALNPGPLPSIPQI